MTDDDEMFTFSCGPDTFPFRSDCYTLSTVCHIEPVERKEKWYFHLTFDASRALKYVTRPLSDAEMPELSNEFANEDSDEELRQIGAKTDD